MTEKERSQDFRAKAKVFLVDDHPIVSKALAELINQEPEFSVCGKAEDAAAAVQRSVDGHIREAVEDLAEFWGLLYGSDADAQSQRRGVFCCGRPCVASDRSVAQTLRDRWLNQLFDRCCERPMLTLDRSIIAAF